ncbi:MAG TPA: hypothetical protein DDW76_00755 [Cyanobacteria bacterium UBA11369]|nr:hypothetical protein [Cyanobacteria bacterium UBA11369]
MLLRNQLGQKVQRVRWIDIAFSIVLASIPEASLCIGLNGAAASLEKDTELHSAGDKTLAQRVASSAVTLFGSAIASSGELGENPGQKTPSILQGQAWENNTWNATLPDLRRDRNSLPAQSSAEPQPINLHSQETVEQYPLPTANDLEGFPHRETAEKLLDIEENRTGENNDRWLCNALRQSQSRSLQLESECQPTLAQNESNTQETNGDPDLGILRLRQQELPPPAPPPKPTPPPPPPRGTPVLHLLPRISYFQSNNIFSSVDPVGDSLIYPSLMLWAVPQLGRNTFLTPSIEGSLIRYIREPQFNYNLLRLRTGISQRLSRGMFGEIGWTNQQFYRAEVGDRFLNEHMAYLSLSRQDQLTQRLRLNSYYDFRVSFADPDNRSRIINSLYLSLSYSFQTNLQLAMDYQFERSDFTVRDRYDQYHRIMGRLTYGVLRDSQISVSGGVSVGGSSEPWIDFDSLFFSVTYSVDFPIY